ncbi:MAG: M14 family zinc carboxypeptidase, partial [Robiginitalea sp.]|nr:M14 family zinc carboxypeptidase [Robiginitalea sp.]
MSERAAYEQIRVSEVEGRYLPPETLEAFLTARLPGSAIDVLGYSVEKRPVFGVRLGSGPIRVLMWSQMHGNESTTTRAVLDLINSLIRNAVIEQDAFEFFLIPMLNPDGARAYTRHNANGVDLNRDAQLQSQPESIILRSVYGEFAPQFCFNLHDQRTIFSAGDPPKPATLSFLAPAA